MVTTGGAFGGKEDEGVPDFTNVNWQKLTDYMRWEAASWGQLRERAEKLQQAALKKYDHHFMHYNAYEVW